VYGSFRTIAEQSVPRQPPGRHRAHRDRAIDNPTADSSRFYQFARRARIESRRSGNSARKKNPVHATRSAAIALAVPRNPAAPSAPRDYKPAADRFSLARFGDQRANRTRAQKNRSMNRSPEPEIQSFQLCRLFRLIDPAGMVSGFECAPAA
jgi:hypothetical protein